MFVGISMFLVGFACLSPTKADRETEWVVSEVMSNPLDEKSGEFIEFEYLGNTSLDLSGWYIEDNMQTDVVVDYESEFDGGRTGLLVEPGDVVLVVDGEYQGEYNGNFASSEIDLSRVVMVTTSDVNIGNGLGNAKDIISLYDRQKELVVSFSWDADSGNGVSVELVGGEWRKCSLEAGNSFGWSRRLEKFEESGDLDEDISIWDRFWEEGEKPIFVNELMIDPSGDDAGGEWIEIKKTLDSSINLAGWYICDSECEIEDKSGGRKLGEDIVWSGDYLVLTREQTGIALNNGQDKIILFDPNHDWVDSLEYNMTVMEGKSYSYNSSDWRWTESATPGEENIFIEVLVADGTDSVEKEVADECFYYESILAVKNSSDGDCVEFEGVVVVEYNILERNYLWLNDDSAGIRVKFDDDPGLVSGEYIVVKGSRNDLTYVKTVVADEYQRIDKRLQPEPIEFDGQLAGDLVDRLVQIRGEVVEKNGQTLMVATNDFDYKVYLKDSVGKLNYKKGDFLRVVGIVDEINSGLRILPRSLKDISPEISADKLPTVGMNWGNLIEYFLGEKIGRK